MLIHIHTNRHIKILILCTLILSVLNLTGRDKSFTSDSIKVISLTKTGLSLHRNGMYTEALDSFLLSREIRKKIYNHNNFNAFARINYYIAVTYKNLGLYDLAIEYSKLAEQAYINGYGKNYERIALVYLNLGNIYRSKLDYAQALEYYKQMVSIYENQEKTDKINIAGAYYSIAEIYYKMYEYNKAIQVIEHHLKNADEDTKILYFDLLGAIYRELKNNIQAKKNYQEAIDLAKRIYSEKDYHMYLGFEYLNFANFLISIGEIENAENIIHEAKPYIFANQNSKGLYAALYYRNMASLLKSKHIESNDINIFMNQKIQNLHNAVNYYKDALKALNFTPEISSTTTLDSLHNISNIECLNLLQFIGQTYFEISKVYESQSSKEYSKNIKLSLHYSQIAGAFLQRIRKESSGDENKILLAELEQSTFTDVVKTSYLAYKIDGSEEYLNQAFINAERLKSGSIFDKLEETLAKENSLIPDSLLQKEKLLNARITAYNEQRFNETTKVTPDMEVVKQADSILFQLNQQRNNLNGYLEKNYSDYYDLKYSSTLFNVTEIQNKLKRNELLIEYVLNETDSIPELYSIAIDCNSAKFIKQNIDKQFIKDIESTFYFMSNPKYMFAGNEDSKNFCNASYALYQKLIAPFEKEIIDKKLIIVPDGKLNYIAFDALMDALPDTTENIQFNKLNYLIKKNCINYSYSANLLYKFDNLSRKAQKSVLAFAPEYQSDTISFAETSKLVLMPLPGVVTEVNNIAQEIKTKAFEGSAASEANFRKNAENYDILHLAMHAFINDSLPAFSRLAFTQGTGKKADNDGWLNTADIYNLNLNARLTVLSACNTGTGTLKKGEGVMSLARGFLYAGCPSIIMTLWNVEDNSGTKIMSSFYGYLKKGKSKDEALRLAKLDYLNEANPRLAHPHYWLGYVNIGNSAPLYRSYDFYFFSILIIAFVGIATEQIFRIKKARKKRKK